MVERPNLRREQAGLVAKPQHAEEGEEECGGADREEQLAADGAPDGSEHVGGEVITRSMASLDERPARRLPARLHDPRRRAPPRRPGTRSTWAARWATTLTAWRRTGGGLSDATGLVFARVRQVHGTRVVRAGRGGRADGGGATRSSPSRRASRHASRSRIASRCSSRTRRAAPSPRSTPGGAAPIALAAAEGVRALAREGADPRASSPPSAPRSARAATRSRRSSREHFRAALRARRSSRAGAAPRLDLWRANLLALEEAGVRPERVEVLGRCTACERDLFFSHRRDAGRTGRQVGFIAPARDARGAARRGARTSTAARRGAPSLTGSPRSLEFSELWAPLARNASAALVLAPRLRRGRRRRAADVRRAPRGAPRAAPGQRGALRARWRRSSGAPRARSRAPARAARAGAASRAAPTRRRRRSAAPVVPPDLAVVKVAPAERHRRRPHRDALPEVAAPPARGAAAAGADRHPDRRARARAARGARAPGRSRTRGGGRPRAAGRPRARRPRSGARARGLRARYPRHPAADNALVEAAEAYADGRQGRRGVRPRAARRRRLPRRRRALRRARAARRCESRRGDAGAERRILERLVSEFPRTPAAERAGTRLAAISGQRRRFVAARPGKERSMIRRHLVAAARPRPRRGARADRDARRGARHRAHRRRGRARGWRRPPLPARRAATPAGRRRARPGAVPVPATQRRPRSDAGIAPAAAGAALALEDAAGGQPTPDTYTVRPGDTLWDLSGRFLNNPWYWPKNLVLQPGHREPALDLPGQPPQVLPRPPTRPRRASSRCAEAEPEELAAGARARGLLAGEPHGAREHRGAGRGRGRRAVQDRLRRPACAPRAPRHVRHPARARRVRRDLAPRSRRSSCSRRSTAPTPGSSGAPT